MKKYIIFIFLVIATGAASCEKFFEPAEDNSFTEEVLLRRPSYAEGVLLTAYVALPTDYNFFSDIPTDDAVTNLKGSNYTSLATGSWSASFCPDNPWNNAYTQIFYLNKFLHEIVDKINWTYDPYTSPENNARRDDMTFKRMKGEAYGLRAFYKFQLLQYHSGKVNGELLGMPIINKNLSTEDNWQLPRDTFKECVKSIFEDIDSAIAILPDEYIDISEEVHDMVLGTQQRGRINAKAAKALKSRVALLAASPSYESANTVTWAEAAKIAGEFLKEYGALLSTGRTSFYTEYKNKEIIWNRGMRQINTWEAENFPPSLYGKGRTNPTQNLVDAFPMRNGYPIDHPSAVYNSAQPYSNRDLRLADYIIYNGLNFKNTINTYIDAPSNGINKLETSTRTGYYLKKFMLPAADLNPTNPKLAVHSFVFFRETEVLLNFCEAANEAWGPTGDPEGLGFTAKSKLAELRTRAGITGGDQYLQGINDPDEFRQLIRNERRIELCFEGFRFWDIRRWNDVTTMQEPVKGAFITKTGSTYTYEYNVIEERVFGSHMIYGPIPFNETLKYDIKQNDGWSTSSTK